MLCLTCPTSVDKLDFATAHIAMLACVGLYAFVLFAVACKANHTRQAVECRVTEPRHVYQAVIDQGEWVYHHTAPSKRGVADNEITRLNSASFNLLDALAIYGELIFICLHVACLIQNGKFVASVAAAIFIGAGRTSDFRLNTNT